MRSLLRPAAVVSLVCACSIAHAATRVELVIDEPFESRNVPWPVTTGVPFPRGKLTKENQCRLVDDLGVEQRLQSRVTATWDAKRSSTRWLTIDFIAHPGRSYALEFGDEIARHSARSSLTVTPGTISTGPLEVHFDPNETAAIRSIRVDINGDKRITVDEEIASRPIDGEHYYIDQRGRRFSNAADPSNTKIVVESAGPIRACVRCDGSYVGPDGTRIVDVRTRYHMFSGLSLIKAVHEFRIVGSTKQTRFQDIGFELLLPRQQGRRTVVVDASGEAGNQVQSIPWQPGTTGVSSSQTIYRHFGNPECRGSVIEERGSNQRVVSESDYVGEWLQIQDDNVTITGSLRWMWQQFPKEWEVSRDRLTLHLWGPRGGELDFGADGIRSVFGEGGRRDLLEWGGVPKNLNAISNYFYRAGFSAMARDDVDGKGINKHHEFWLHFGSKDQAAEGMEYGKLAALQPLALATPEWNCSTDVFGPLMPRRSKNTKESPADAITTDLQGFDAAPYEAIVDRLFDLGRYAQDAFGDYGWWIFGSGPHYSYQWDKENKRHYADPRRFEYHTYQKETQLWWNYLRSGERKFYDWAIPSENHWVDIAATHVPVDYECDWRGGFEKKQMLQMRPGDWSIDSPLFYVRQRDSAEAWLRGCSQFQASYHRTLETTSLAYYITGDERFNDVIEFWRKYWRDLAGRTSASSDMPTWIREQPWYEPTAPGEPAKTWAEMVRDYCPFTSGLRHQMTYFFSLATLYEHTWDPKIGQVLKECADAYLDPDHRIGVWRTQENGLPAHADAPELAHFWVPALWKYARATQDPRMPDIFKRYFEACYSADPFREDVGRYSDVHIGYAYYFTRDARHLRPALLALDRLLPNAEPLARPEDIGRRLYNPYAPIQSFTAVPRLLWALDQAKRDRVKIPERPVLMPQRTAIAIYKSAARPLHATLWGYDRELALIGPDGKEFDAFTIATTRAASRIQPFDRVMSQFQVYLHDVSIPAESPEGFYVLAPSLELAVLNADDGSGLELQDEIHGNVMINASQLVTLDDDRTFFAAVRPDSDKLVIESKSSGYLVANADDATQLKTSIADDRLMIESGSLQPGMLIEIGKTTANWQSTFSEWFRIADSAPDDCWVGVGTTRLDPPTTAATRAALAAYARKKTRSDRPFVEGRFGRGILLKAGRTLRFPDHVGQGDKLRRLFDLREGTVEFFIKQMWDERIDGINMTMFVTNGLIATWNQQRLPVRKWTHVAFEWRPLKRDPSRIAMHVYVDGLDRRNYRSTWWEGYSQKPLTLPQNSTWKREFLCEAKPETPYVIDEIRVSTIARYADQSVELGGRQIFNPSRFAPPEGPFDVDEHTALLLHLDGDVTMESGQVNELPAAQLQITTDEAPR